MSKRKSGYAAETKMINAIDRLSRFEEFEAEILPMLRADLKSKKTPEELRKKYATYLEVRKITIALSDPDSSKALTAIKDLNDRSEGRAVERKEVSHKFENLKDEEIDSILLSKLADSSETSRKKDDH